MDDFETWLKKAQGIPIETIGVDRLPFWRELYERAMIEDARWRAQPAPSGSARHGDRRYAVAIADGNELGLTFWIRRSKKGEIFLLIPRVRDMDPHASYHLDGTYHHKTYGMKTPPKKRHVERFYTVQRVAIQHSATSVR